MNIYVQDDLAEQVKQLDDLNISAVCQDALRQEVERRNTLARYAGEMHRVEVYLEDRDAQVAFVAREIHHDIDHCVTAYLTKRGRVAIYDDDLHVLHQYDSFADLKSDDAWEFHHSAMLSAIAEALGEKHVIELDI